MKKQTLLAAFIFSLFSVCSNVKALTLDDFTLFGRAEVTSETPTSDFKNVIDTSAIGGNRLLFISRTSAFNGSTTEILSNLRLSHSQGSGVRALSRVTWDKDSNPNNPVNPAGLGSVDLLQDSATALKLKISFDYANGQSADVKLKFFDSTDLTANTATEIFFTLNQILTDYELVIPFSILQTSGNKTLSGPTSNIPATVFTTIDGITTISRVGAIFMEINGQNGDSDLSLEFIKTNGICESLPDEQGDVIDDCGICRGQPGYKQPKDSCGYCPSDPDYNKPKDTCDYCPKDPDYGKPKDECNYCAKDPDYGVGKDDCGLCPKQNSYNNAKDPCNVCFGDGSSCADCSGQPNGNSKLDQCNVCNGNGTTCLDCAGTPFGTKVLDACNICGGSTQDPNACNVTEQCTTVQASSEILAFEKRLVNQATTITKKYKDEDKRNKRNACGINSKPSTSRVNKAFETIKNVGNDIFTKGVEICGDGCVTVSYADQVKALVPVLKVIESETKSLAKKVQKCYKRKKIKTTQSVAGVQTTIKNVTNELNQLIQDCKDKQVCK